MQCKEVKRMISRYIDGEIEEEKQKNLEAHLKFCQGCQKQYMKIARMWNALNESPDLAPNPWAFTRLQAQLNHPAVPSVPSLWERLLIPGTTVVMLVTGLWLGSLTWSGNNTEIIKNNSEESWENAYTASIEPVPESSLSSVYIELASSTNGGTGHE